MKKEMLINVLQPEECRIAILEDGVLEELYVERTTHESYTGNIYKGRTVNLEPAIQAAFVDFSVGRNGFLHVSDVEPRYYRRHLSEEDQLGGRDRGREPWRDEPRSPRETERVDRDDDRGGREGSREETRSMRDPDRMDRDETRPRREGGTERAEPRRTSFDERETRPFPPQLEDLSREQDLDQPERPDRLEKGRRERSPRRFGEGLIDEWQEPPAYPTIPPPPATPQFAPAQEESPPQPLPKSADTSPREASGDIGAPRSRRFRAHPSAELAATSPPPGVEESPITSSSWQTTAAPDVEPAPSSTESSVEDDLPPSRTHRGRSGRTRSLEPDRPPRGAPGPESTEPLPEARPSRARGRSSHVTPESLDQGDEPRAGDPSESGPRARSGRAAIRARGEGPRQPPTSSLGEPTDAGRDAPPAGRPERPRRRTREAGSAGESTRTPRSHSRAGEPGYVPRRERLREFAEFDPEAPTQSIDWGDERPGEQEEPPTELDRDADAGLSEETGDRPDPNARRRRRRRRRRPTTAADRYSTEASADELEAEPLEPDTEEVAEAPRTRPRPARAPRRGRARDPFAVGDDLSLEDDDFESDSAFGAVERDPKDTIDPELEEEIRREIEEITAIEREMGLRGPAEPRSTRRGEEELALEDRPRLERRSGRIASKPPIQEIFRRGDEVLVQVIKESIGTKGPTLSTYISIPGRYLVLMPGLNRVGVSRKIADEAQRRKLREIMNELNPPKGLGFIVRTAGLDRSKMELARDLAYLLRLWKVILKRIRKTRSPALIYQESDMITRTIRDIFTSEIDTIWIDERGAFERAQEFLKVVMPKFVDRLKFYDEKVPLFHKYGLEEEIAKIQRRRVDLSGGGSIVIDQTEALVAIDVNSGNFRVEDDAERTAYEMNLRAAKEIARQLRLRDLGGVIVNDFIDMREERNRRNVERTLREAVKRDRARTKILRMSQFGIIEMTRQRIRPSLKRSVYEDCPHCGGAGVVKTAESVSIDVMRLLALAAHREDIRRVNVTVNSAVATYLNNRKRGEITRLESDSRMLIHVRHEPDVPAEHLHIDCFDLHNNEVRLLPAPPPPSHARRMR
jgi:ribonuclease E